MRTTDLYPGDVLTGKYDDGRSRYLLIMDKAILAHEYADRTVHFEMVRVADSARPRSSSWVESSKLRAYARLHRDINADVYDHNGNLLDNARYNRLLSREELNPR